MPNISDFDHLIELLQHRAKEQSHQTAYTFLRDGEKDEESISYLHLKQQASQIANLITRENIAGARVLLLMPPGLDFIKGFFGCLFARVIAVPTFVPANKRKAKILIDIIKDAGIRFVLSTTPVIKRVQPLLREYAGVDPLTFIDINESDSSQSLPSNSHEIQAEDIALLQYTSGSTSKPKGVIITHQNILSNSAIIQEYFGHDKESRGLIWLPPYHDMGLMGGIIQPLFVGFPVVLMSPLHFIQRPLRWLKAISTYRATTSGGPNFSYDLCVSHISEESCRELDLSSWRVAFNGGEKVRQQTIEAFSEKFKVRGFKKQHFLICYGLAEATLMVSGNRHDTPPRVLYLDKKGLLDNKVIITDKHSPDSQPIVSSGTVSSGFNVKIVHPDRESLCGHAEIGKILLAGGSSSSGYWGEDRQHKHENKPAFIDTGDLGFLYEDHLYITGRDKEMIVIRGQNYYPTDIEEIVGNCHPGIRENGCAAIMHSVDGREHLVLFIEISRHALNQNYSGILQKVRQAVSDGFGLKPSDIVPVGPYQIPRTSSGKIKRYVCKQMYEQRTLQSGVKDS